MVDILNLVASNGGAVLAVIAYVLGVHEKRLTRLEDRDDG
jgi:hypothetical protein